MSGLSDATPCGPFRCEAATHDGVLCASDECDIATGARTRASGAGEAVAWQVRRADGRNDGVPIQWESCTQELYDATLSTGRYAGYENGPCCEVRALYGAPAQQAVTLTDDARDAARYRAFFDAGLPITFLGVDYRDKAGLDAAIDAALQSSNGEKTS